MIAARQLSARDEDGAKDIEALLPLVYEELRKLAAARLANEQGTQTLQPTALVHEAWLRLVGVNTQPWQNRAHFFAAAAEAMKLRFFVGFSYEEAAQTLGISVRSAKRGWAFARAWLYRELSG